MEVDQLASHQTLNNQEGTFSQSGIVSQIENQPTGLIQEQQQKTQNQPIMDEDINDDGDQSDNGNYTSGTSSYSSDNDEERKDEKISMLGNDNNGMEVLDEFEENTLSSYAKFKTQNEIDLEQIEKYAPKIPELDELDDIIEFGKINKYIQDGNSYIVLVTPSDSQQIYDLDNIVCFQSKQVVGFVLDLVGQVNQAQYSVRLYPSFTDKCTQQGLEIKNQILDQKVYLVVKCLKVINTQLPILMNKKGCDASNLFDEELPEHERDFSDDEKEREAKKAKKNKKRKNRNEDRDMEEGELEDQVVREKSNQNSHYKNKNNDKFKKRFQEQGNSGYQKNGSQIPVYSTNFSVNQNQQQYQMHQQQQQMNQMGQQYGQGPYFQNMHPMMQQQQYNMYQQQQMAYMQNPLFFSQNQVPQQMQIFPNQMWMQQQPQQQIYPQLNQTQQQNPFPNSSNQ
ncbi:snornp assembly factor [Stylonychia lemnae]|uniref:H/ACA ribonucleoprotein complex non-core subunit NAF1 n=1 Tax=Stylonychia lemnae TaxID=5949 RepID=A0A078AGE2_STYLE|nr:snornp assembly factor [Stylonychia lemnae]|eukprot:CDW80607.1 snornp assembly factor [Stylonychia lemnae]